MALMAAQIWGADSMEEGSKKYEYCKASDCLCGNVFVLMRKKPLWMSSLVGAVLTAVLWLIPIKTVGSLTLRL